MALLPRIIRRKPTPLCNFRPDLTDYELLIMALVDKLNEKSVHKMSKTDAVKIAIEKAVNKILPDITIKPKRKKYISLDL